MSLVKWDESYSVRVNGLDNQHKQLFALINQLHDAMIAGKASTEMSGVLAELITYTKTHFSAEEKLLESKHYPDLEAHKAQHRQFTDKIVQFQKDLDSGKAALSIALMHYLRDWLTNHILKTDKRYSSYLAPEYADAAGHHA
jgi:hemerythrin